MPLVCQWDRSSGGHCGMSERSGCSHCVLCRWDRVSPGVARAVGVTAPVYVPVSEFPPRLANLSSKGVSPKLVTKCLLTLKLRLLPLNVDCLCETFFPDYVKSVQMFALDDEMCST